MSQLDIRPLAEGISVGAQVTPADVPLVHALGFRAMICNRPDGEAPDQPLYADIAAAAAALDIEMRYIPVVPGRSGAAEVEAFAQAMAALPRPLLAWCRSGARSATLAQAAAGKAG